MLTRLLALLLALPVLLASPAFAVDYDVVNEDIWPSQNDVAQTTGNGKKLLENQWQEAMLAITEGSFIYSGCALPASSVNLNISIPACQGLINGRFIDIPGSTTITASASTTNHVFLKFVRDGASLATGAKFEVNTTGTAPADSVKLGTMVASGSAITSTTDMRRMGMPAVSRGPWSVGTGSTRSHEGAVTIASNQSLSGIHYYTDFTLNSGVTLTVPGGSGRLVIVASGTITINGTISGAGGGVSAGAGSSTGTGASGLNGTAQAGGGGGSSAGAVAGGGGGSVALHGITVQAGGPGGTTGGAGSAGTQLSGSSVPLLANPLTCIGGASGGSGGSDGSASGAGGRGGASIILVAPAVTLASTATLNTSGAVGGNGTTNGAGGGGGGAGNVYIVTRSYTDNGATFTQTGGSGGSGAGVAASGGAGASGVKQISLY